VQLAETFGERVAEFYPLLAGDLGTGVSRTVRHLRDHEVCGQQFVVENSILFDA